jgi:hypothetical protein
MAQQGKQMRVGAREGFAYHSVKVALLIANGNTYEVDSNKTFIFSQTLLGVYLLATDQAEAFSWREHGTVGHLLQRVHPLETALRVCV